MRVKNKKMRSKGLIFALAILVCVSLMKPAAVSANENDGEAEVSVEIDYSSNYPESEKTGTWSFSPDNSAESEGTINPDSSYQILGDGYDGNGTFTWSGESGKIRIKFAHVGVYKFTLKQTTPDKSRYVLDRTVYTLRFYVKDGPEDLEVLVTVQKDGEEKKADNLVFANSRKSPGGGSSGTTSPPPKATTARVLGIRPRTGDTPWTILYIGLLLVSAGVLVRILIKRKKDDDA